MNDGPISSEPKLQRVPCRSGRVAFDDLFRIKNIGSFISRLQIGLLGVAPHDSWSTAAPVACTLEWETPEIVMNCFGSDWHTYCQQYYAIVFS